MVQEGLAITRAIHDRYHAARRNPWNEVECGDHYARAMASYGVFLAACGYEYHGPARRLAFDPRLTPNDFRAAFTTAEGWGVFLAETQRGIATRSDRTTLGTACDQDDRARSGAERHADEDFGCREWRVDPVAVHNSRGPHNH